MLKCRSEADAAAQWLAYARNAAGDAAGSRNVIPLAPASFSGPAARVDALAQARVGRYADLLRKIDEPAPGFAAWPEAQLVLARALVRDGRFARGQQAYVDYLRLRPDDDAAEAEYLFSFLWAGDAAEAERQLAQAARYPMRPELAAAVARARRELERRRGSAPRALPEPEAAAPVPAPPRERPLDGDAPRLEAGAALVRVDGAFRRDTGRVAYAGRIQVSHAVHRLSAYTPEVEEQRASETWAVGRLGTSPGLGAEVGIGFLAASDAAALAILRVALDKGPDGPAVGVGIERTPLAPSMPLAGDDVVAVRDALSARLRWRRLVEASAALLRDSVGDDLYAAFARYELLGRLRLGGAADAPTFADARLPLALETRPRPSPLEVSDRRVATAGLGLEGAAALGRAWGLSGSIDYLIETVTTRDNTPRTRRHGLVSARAGAEVALGDAARGRLLGIAQRSDDPARQVARHLPLGLALDLALAL